MPDKLNPLESLRRMYGRHLGKWWLVQSLAWLLLGILLATWFVGERSDKENTVAGPGSSVQSVSDEATMWTCAMHPQIRQPKPGKCPICGMDLIPVSKSAPGMRTLTISPEARALMQVETTPVERKYVEHELRMVGKLDYDETRLGYITAWVSGRLDRLYVDYTGIHVNKGDHMVYLYSPELYSAQEELIQAVRYRNQSTDTNRLRPIDLAESAREKLRLLGLSEEQIKQIEQQDKPSDHLTIYSPVSGVVIDKLKQEGDYVRTGERIYTIADLSQLWVRLDAYESDIPWLRYAQDVVITTEAYPGEEFHGRIAFIEPFLNDATRTVKVRVNVPNKEGKLKPKMFVRAVVRPKIAAGGRVMDPSLVGKWICPMHPEVMEDEPGKCPICSMPLVRVESLGYVAPDMEAPPPLVIPTSAALVTGRRAIVYVELPEMPPEVETAFEQIRSAVAAGQLSQATKAFGQFLRLIEQPYPLKGTGYARALWQDFSSRLVQPATTGYQAESLDAAAQALATIEPIMAALREAFGPYGQPTYEGREILLGPRAGNYYLVRRGLSEGELVVTRGNFKIDAEIQIQAKPSMMTPEGGGSGGHHHGGSGSQTRGEQATTGETGHSMTLPAGFAAQLRRLYQTYQRVGDAIDSEDMQAIRNAFAELNDTLQSVDDSQLTGHARVIWHELAMLLGNDAVEGSDAQQLSEVKQTWELLTRHMHRLMQQMGISVEAHGTPEQLPVDPQFQSQLAGVWNAYLVIQQALADDQFNAAKRAVAQLRSAIAAIDSSTLTTSTRDAWSREMNNLNKLVDGLQQANDIADFRAQFKALSSQIGVIARRFGFGPEQTVYELHCPMAFEGTGAVWYQASDQVRNPYYGPSMLQCSDRVEKVLPASPPAAEQPQPPHDHAGH